MNNSLRGKAVPAYIFACFHCGVERTFNEATGQSLPKWLAEKWARAEGWTKTKNGWAHKACADHFKRK